MACLGLNLRIIYISLYIRPHIKEIGNFLLFSGISEHSNILLEDCTLYYRDQTSVQ